MSVIRKLLETAKNGGECVYLAGSIGDKNAAWGDLLRCNPEGNVYRLELKISFPGGGRVRVRRHPESILGMRLDAVVLGNGVPSKVLDEIVRPALSEDGWFRIAEVGDDSRSA